MYHINSYHIKVYNINIKIYITSLIVKWLNLFNVFKPENIFTNI